MPRRSKGPHPFRVTITRHVDTEGKRCPKDTPGARQVKSLSESYYTDIWDGKSRKRIPLGTSDLATAWANLRAILKRQAEAELGIRDRFAEAAEVPLEKHIDDWVESAEARGVSPKQCLGLRSSVLELARLAGWRRITDIDYDSALKALARLQRPTEGNPQGLSAQTRNHYTKKIKQFTNWAAGHSGRLRTDPLKQLATVDVSTDRRHDRRTPSDEEIGKLFEYLEGADALEVEGMSGRHRALAYRVAMATGLRAGELRSLTPSSFDLERATVTVAASYSKRRREDVLPLPPWLVILIRDWFTSGGRCFDGFPAEHPGKVLKADLASARIPYTVKNAAGVDLYFDFHSLRHYFCSWAGNLVGISPRALLALTRHSTPELAMQIYGQTKTSDVRTAVDGMPEPGR